MIDKVIQNLGEQIAQAYIEIAVLKARNEELINQITKFEKANDESVEEASEEDG